MKVISFPVKTANKNTNTLTQSKVYGKSDTQLLSEAFKALKEQRVKSSK